MGVDRDSSLVVGLCFLAAALLVALIWVLTSCGVEIPR